MPALSALHWVFESKYLSFIVTLLLWVCFIVQAFYIIFFTLFWWFILVKTTLVQHSAGLVINFDLFNFYYVLNILVLIFLLEQLYCLFWSVSQFKILICKYVLLLCFGKWLKFTKVILAEYVLVLNKILYLCWQIYIRKIINV